MKRNRKGTHFDFTNKDGGLSDEAITIIESNTGIQVNVLEGFKELTWSDELLTKIDVYEDSSKNKKLWTITLTYDIDDNLSEVVKVNEDNSITTTTTLTWNGDFLASVEID